MMSVLDAIKKSCDDIKNSSYKGSPLHFFLSESLVNEACKSGILVYDVQKDAYRVTELGMSSLLLSGVQYDSEIHVDRKI